MGRRRLAAWPAAGIRGPRATVDPCLAPIVCGGGCARSLCVMRGPLPVRDARGRAWGPAGVCSRSSSTNHEPNAYTCTCTLRTQRTDTGQRRLQQAAGAAGRVVPHGRPSGASPGGYEILSQHWSQTGRTCSNASGRCDVPKMMHTSRRRCTKRDRPSGSHRLCRRSRPPASRARRSAHCGRARRKKAGSGTRCPPAGPTRNQKPRVGGCTRRETRVGRG